MSVFVQINPHILTWARVVAGYSIEEAADKISIKSERLAAIEAGDGQLTLPQLKKAAEVFKRPLAFFFLREPPEKPASLHDFRLQPGVAFYPYSPRLNFEIRKASLHREDALDLAKELDQKIPQFRHQANLQESPEEVGRRVRKILGVDVGQQREWGRTDKALKSWKAAVEAQSVLIFETSRIPVREMRGVSLPAGHLPVIILNGGDANAGRVFTLLHEFTHLLLRQGGVCDLVQTEENTPDSRLEAFCNAVAGAALVPAEALLDDIENQSSRNWDINELGVLAQHFSVSKEVILRRLLTLGRTSDAHYKVMREQFRQEYEQMEAGREKSSGGPSPAVMAVRNLGQPFVRLVLNAYAEERISLSTVSDYLGVKLKHLPRIEDLLRRSGSIA